MAISIKKASGKFEPLCKEKILTTLSRLSYGLNVDPSVVYLGAKLNFYDGMATNEISTILSNYAASLATEKDTSYDKLAARIYVDMLESNVGYTVTDYQAFITNNYKVNVSNDHLEAILSDRDPNTGLLNKNLLFSYYGIIQLHKKYMYGVEEPQLMFLSIAYSFAKSMKDIYSTYEALSTFKFQLPSPAMKALRTGSNDIASCCTIAMGDSIDSWCETDMAIVKHTTASAGIGIDISNVSSVGDVVRNGKIIHGGKLPLLRSIETSINKAIQNGRSGAATVFVNFFDKEIIDILNIKSPRTAVDKRVNDLKYGIKLHSLLFDRAENDEYITLLSTRDIPDYQTFSNIFHSGDTELFRLSYERVERTIKNPLRIKARELLEEFIVARLETGVYYPMFVDNTNKGNRFTKNVIQSNLCMEFLSPTQQLTSNNKQSPDIGICILAGINQGTVSIDELEDITKLVVYGLNSIIHNQTHPTEQANEYIKQYASLGVGISNHAYFLAKHGVKYNDTNALDLTAKWVETFQYGLVKASIEYAKEFGVSCNRRLTKYGYKELYEKLENQSMYKDGRWLRLWEEAKHFGIANAVLSMIMPSETSSSIGNQTNNIIPIRNLTTTKDSSSGVLTQYVPEVEKFGCKYEIAYNSNDINTRVFLHVSSSFLPWIDMGISLDTFHNPQLTNGRINATDVYKELKLANDLGLKTLYYSNVYLENASNITEEVGCSSGGCTL